MNPSNPQLEDDLNFDSSRVASDPSNTLMSKLMSKLVILTFNLSVKLISISILS